MAADGGPAGVRPAGPVGQLAPNAFGSFTNVS